MAKNKSAQSILNKNCNVEYMHQAAQLCNNSKCGYKTGCVVVKKGTVLVEGWNETLAGEVYCQNGTCIREEKGLSGGREIEKVCCIHAESSVVAQAATKGIALTGTSVYVTTFPCLICARLLAKTRVGKVYYMTDYMGSDLGRSVLEGANIQIKQVSEKEVWEYDASLKKSKQ